MGPLAFNMDDINSPEHAGLKRCSRAPLHLLVERMGAFPSSGEIRLKVSCPSSVLTRIKDLHGASALALVGDETEALEVVLADWRFMLRASMTQSEITLCVISRGDAAFMQMKTLELLAQIDGIRC